MTDLLTSRAFWNLLGFVIVIGPQAGLCIYVAYLILRRPEMPKNRYEITSAYGFQIVYAEAASVIDLVKELKNQDWVILSSPKGDVAIHSDFGKNILSVEMVKGEPRPGPRPTKPEPPENVALFEHQAEPPRKLLD